MRNFCGVLSYDGTRYRGWQKQGNTERTLQGRLETILSALLSQPIEVAGSGRTDAGVHARGQVFSFHAETEMPAEQLEAELRKQLPDDIVLRSLREAEPRFHARLHAKGKTYRYTVDCGEAPDVFLRRYAWQIEKTLDLDAMRRAAELLKGTHDFSAFCTGTPKGKKNAVRTLTEIQIAEGNGIVTLTFTGDGFLYNMVRILTGTLVEIGLHRIPAEALSGILASKLRQNAGPTAPAQGLCLMEVHY